MSKPEQESKVSVTKNVIFSKERCVHLG